MPSSDYAAVGGGALKLKGSGVDKKKKKKKPKPSTDGSSEHPEGVGGASTALTKSKSPGEDERLHDALAEEDDVELSKDE
jgi:protein FAM32A